MFYSSSTPARHVLCKLNRSAFPGPSRHPLPQYDRHLGQLIVDTVSTASFQIMTPLYRRLHTSHVVQHSDSLSTAEPSALPGEFSSLGSYVHRLVPFVLIPFYILGGITPNTLLRFVSTLSSHYLADTTHLSRINLPEWVNSAVPLQREHLRRAVRPHFSCIYPYFLQQLPQVRTTS